MQIEEGVGRRTVLSHPRTLVFPSEDFFFTTLFAACDILLRIEACGNLCTCSAYAVMLLINLTPLHACALGSTADHGR